MQYNLVHKKDLPSYLSLTSKNLRGQMVEIEIIGDDVGDQIEKDWCNSDGLAYDPEENILYIFTRPLIHFIRGPRDFSVATEGLSVRYMTLKDAEGRVQVIHFREPLMLQAPPPLVDAKY